MTNDGPPTARAFDPTPVERSSASDVSAVSWTLSNLVTALDGLAEALAYEGPQSDLERDGCCEDVDAAHMHGRELGWNAALAWVAEMVDGAMP